MNTKVSNFDLITSMMKRLEVSPSVLTINWLQERVLSFSCVAQNLLQNKQEQCLIGKCVSQELHPAEETSKAVISLTQNNESASNFPEINVPESSDSQRKNVKPNLLNGAVSQKNVFYEEDWRELPDEFELSAETVFSTRCGMFAYLQGKKVIISKTLLSRKQVRKQKFVFIGVLFAQQENQLHALKASTPHSGCGYGSALKNMPSNYRFPHYEDCEKIFIYKNILHKAFTKQHINFEAMEKIFHEEADCPKNTACIFNLAKGISEKLPTKSAVASPYYVRVLNINYN